MSLATARIAPAPAPLRAPAPAFRPRLRLVTHTAPRTRRVPFFALCAAILVAALLGALALNTSMASTAYTIRDRSLTLSQTQQQRQGLATELERVSSPTAVMERAAELGLVASEGLAYVELASSSIIGGGDGSTP